MHGIGSLASVWDIVPNCSLYFQLIMFNKLFNNIIVRHGHSDCADYIIANVADGVARVAYKNGNVYEYTNVSRRALLNLVMNDNISLGRWINDCLLFVDSKCAKYGTATQVNLAY